MIDRTNVGISPLLSTPMTTSYVSSTPAYQTIPQTTSYVQEAYPATNYGGQVVTQNVIPQTASYTQGYTQDTFASFAPEITTPDQAIASFVPSTTSVTPAQIQGVQTYQTASATPVQSTTTSVVPNVVFSQQTNQQSTTQPISPILDEDFQRGRPIYDEFTEDRYRNFKFGK